eukprot:02389.XXX_65982_66101_1 [CDS] Oithona nana genome sequencing.
MGSFFFDFLCFSFLWSFRSTGVLNTSPHLSHICEVSPSP